MFLQNVFAVLVLYKTGIKDSATIRTINNALVKSSSQLDMLVYDNSPGPQGYAPEFKYGNLNIRYVHNPLNGGVSKAYNYGAGCIKDREEKKWLLLLDQDTAFSADFFEHMQRALVLNPAITLFVPMLFTELHLFSPGRYWFKTGRQLKNIPAGIYSLWNMAPVNSGMLIKKNAFFQAGQYNEKVKLDFSDFQFIERLRKTQPYFCVVDSIGHQDFSDHETDAEKLNKRYRFFCEGARNCDRHSLADGIGYFQAALRRAVSLTIRTKKIIFLKTFVRHYLNAEPAE